MFYAIEHKSDAYRSLQFTQRRLRDAWIAASTQREIARARDPRIRKAWDVQDGDTEAYEIIARARVEVSPKLARYREELIDYDWCRPDHWQTVATAPERELLDWAATVREQAAEVAE